MTRFCLGVDGGQSGTTALIGDENGRVVGHGRGGPCNHVSGAEAKARFVDAIGSAIRAAAQGIGSHFHSACLGFSGGAEDKSIWLDELFTADRRVVTHDGMIALAGATGGLPGVVVIAGTGQFAFGRSQNGRTARAGGWGYIYGDEGAGFDIARQALRAALRFEEGWGPETELRGMLLALTDAKSANDLLHRLYALEFPRQQVAGWARVVDQAAERGDDQALQILKRSGRHLADYGFAVHRNLFSAHENAPIAYHGGVFRSRLVVAAFRDAVLDKTGRRPISPLYDPAAGALLEAYREAGLAVKLSNLPENEK